MAAQYIELDPKGDVILVLNNFPRQQDQGKDDFDDSPSLPAVLPDEISFQRPIEPLEEGSAKYEIINEIPAALPSPPPEGTHEGDGEGEEMPPMPTRESKNLTPEFAVGSIKFFVSSNHLRLASPVFEKMLSGEWAEGSALRTRGITEIKVQTANSEALWVLLHIIHGRTRKVPRTVSLDLLTQLAVLVDYYECHESVEVFSKIWIKSWNKRRPSSYCYDAIQWLCISWVFRDGRIFRDMTRILQRQATNPLQTSDLPIPSRIVDQVNETRQGSIDQIVSVLHQTLEDLKAADIRCTFECDSILLGSMMKELILRGMLHPRPSPPFYGYSVERLCESVRNIRSPRWLDGLQCNHGKLDHLWRLEPVSIGVEESLTGLALSTFAPEG